MFLLLTGPASAQVIPSGLAPFAALFPPDYFGRFAVRAPEFGLTLSDYGVRAFPLPLPGADVRLDLFNHPAYREYGLATRLLDTSLALGVFQNTDAGAVSGVPTLAAIHDPASGVQAAFALRGAGRLSEGRLGYAGSRTEGNQAARLLAELGYGEQTGRNAGFAHVEMSLSRRAVSGPFAFSFSAAGRLYAFPISASPVSAQGSLDLSLALDWRAAPSLHLHADHFERAVVGTATLPALNFIPLRVSHLLVTAAPAWQLGPLQVVSASYTLEYRWLEGYAPLSLLTATGRLALGPLELEFTPRYDFALGVPGTGVALLYRFSGFALGPRVDVSLVGGALKTGFGLAFAAR